MEEKIISRCVYEGDLIRYFDKEGNELHDGDTVVYEDGRKEKLYLTTKGELGTDATNPLWIKDGRAVPCEYGMYPLTIEDLKNVVLEK